MKNLLTKFLILIMVAAVSISLFACGENADDDVETGNFKWSIATEQVDTNTPVYEEDGTTPKTDEYGRVIYEKEEHKYYKITGYTISASDSLKMKDGDFTGLDRNLVIPTDYTGLQGATEDYDVQEIDGSAFANQIIFKTAVIGENIKKIGSGAFAGCSNLEEITVPFIGESEKAVNAKARFGYIFGSTTFDGATTVTAKTHSYMANGTAALSEDDVTYYIPSKLTKVTLTKGEVIKECDFYGMTTIKNIVFPSTLKEIGRYAFYGCTSLNNVVLPSSLEYIYQYAFNGCTGLRNLDFGNNSQLKLISTYAFGGCTTLSENLVSDNVSFTIPASVVNLEANAFNGCTSITKLNLSVMSATEIKEGTFAGCTSLKNVIISTGKTVRGGAFIGCTSLKNTGISGTITSGEIESNAFDFDV